MKVSKFLWSVVVFLTITISVRAQDYFFGSQQPFQPQHLNSRTVSRVSDW